MKNILGKEYFGANSLIKFFFFQIFFSNLEKKNSTIAYEMKKCYSFFLKLSYFESCQIWLNIHMDDCHFEQHHKIEKNLKNRKIEPLLF